MKIIGFIIILISVFGFCRIHYKKPDKKIFFRIASIFALIVGIGLGAGSNPMPDTPKEGNKIVHKISKDYGPKNKAAKISIENEKAKESLSKKQSDVQKAASSLASRQGSTAQTSSDYEQAAQNAVPDLANMNYSGSQIVQINDNQPGFSSNDLNVSNGAWQQYHDLDSLNRVTGADALLNQSLMPHSERERLYVDPTGWHNKRIGNGWLYNRCHLIAYQLTGQNNNLKNLMTGTRSLNEPCMTEYENQVAEYLKAGSNHYVRYSVRPVFRGNELLARGVQLRAQSVGDSSVSFNVYVFNVENGVELNYSDGTSSINR